ncbi:MAG: radical SAM protein, partial [Bryobacteraceae bacterium]
MSGKFIWRTLRNILLRDRPYVARLAFTAKDTPHGGLKTDGMKRVVDGLDRRGVAVISICGGGEPLLRDDFDEIVNYAGGKGLYIKLTSNGAVPLDRYRRLLSSRVNEIVVSLRAVEGGELPFS